MKSFFAAISVLAIISGVLLAEAKPRIAVVLDDAGGQQGYYKELYALPQKVTVAIIPGTIYAQKVYQEVKAKGFEAIAHIPMEPLNKKIKLPGNTIRTDMSKPEIKKLLSKMLEEFPEIKGINNHMGSKISTQENALSAIMEVLQKKEMYFLDSKTNSRSIVSCVGKKYKVPVKENGLFLDGVQSSVSIRNNLEKLIAQAKKRGTAIGIGHIHRKEMLLELAKIMQKYQQEVEFVTVGELFGLKEKVLDQMPRDKLNLRNSDPLEKVLDAILK